MHSSDVDLRDLALPPTELLDAERGEATGITLTKFLATGGMASVFLADVAERARLSQLSPLTPPRIALKVLKPKMAADLARMNTDASALVAREAMALARVMEARPPSEFVVGFYGTGHLEVSFKGAPLRLPWLAIELVEGGADGVSLLDRVTSADEGIDPPRALRLARGMTDGVRTLHDHGILHRDLKPDNILLAGAVDDETPKIADCGIARVKGLLGTVAGMTPAYGGPEQLLSVSTESNPLVGPWTDVHALAAVVWFLLTGEDWCRGSGDRAWREGTRRSLREGHHLHTALAEDPRLLAELDAVLARAASPAIPDEAWEHPSAHHYRERALHLHPALLRGTRRYATVDAFAGELVPILERAAARWASRAAAKDRPATAFRSTQLASFQNQVVTPLVRVEELPAADSSSIGHALARAVSPAERGGAVFQPDGKILARFGENLVYVIGDRAHRVLVPADAVVDVRTSRWLCRGPGGGFAMVGEGHILGVRQGKFERLPFPRRPGGEEVGDIQAVTDAAGTFGVVTGEADDRGGPELWTWSSGGWEEPTVLPLNGDAHAIALGPYGYLVVGSRRGLKARSLQLTFDGQATVVTSGVNERSPLRTCVCGAGREAWAAGDDYLLSIQRGHVVAEEVDMALPLRPVAMALDPGGVPWLLGERGLLRRHVDSGVPRWVPYYSRAEGAAPIIGFGFTRSGCRLFDALGGGALVIPHDTSNWAGQAST